MLRVPKAKKLQAISYKLEHGGIGVLATDTLYGLVGQALNKKAVARIYRVKKRIPTKPLIILIAAISDLKEFGIVPSSSVVKLLNSLWPGPVSIIFTHRAKKFYYLHRGTNTFAFRLPAKKSLRSLIEKTGPLVAPSANHEGEAPAKTIAQAKKYFGPVRSRARVFGASPLDRGAATSNGVDFYVSGRLPKAGKPSTLVIYNDGKITVKRPGAVLIPKKLLA